MTKPLENHDAAIKFGPDMRRPHGSAGGVSLKLWRARGDAAPSVRQALGQAQAPAEGGVGSRQSKVLYLFS